MYRCPGTDRNDANHSLGADGLLVTLVTETMTLETTTTTSEGIGSVSLVVAILMAKIGHGDDEVDNGLGDTDLADDESACSARETKKVHKFSFLSLLTSISTTGKKSST